MKELLEVLEKSLKKDGPLETMLVYSGRREELLLVEGKDVVAAYHIPVIPIEETWLRP